VNKEICLSRDRRYSGKQRTDDGQEKQ